MSQPFRTYLSNLTKNWCLSILKYVLSKITGDSDKLIVQYLPRLKTSFWYRKQMDKRFKMVYFWLGRYCTNQLISLSEFPVIYGLIIFCPQKVLHYAKLISKFLFRQMEPGPSDSHCPSLHPGAPVRPQPRRPSSKWRSWALESEWGKNRNSLPWLTSGKYGCPSLIENWASILTKIAREHEGQIVEFTGSFMSEFCDELFYSRYYFIFYNTKWKPWFPF